MTYTTTLKRARSLSAASKRVILFLGTVSTAAAGAQLVARPITSATFDATRAELTHRLDSLVADSAKGKPAVRRQREGEIKTLRQRLTDGDLQSGDRFLVDYGDPLRRPDTVVVRDSGEITMYNWPTASLHGVLNSELQSAVEKYVGKFVREPRLRAYALARISFSGGWGRPGVYAVDPKRPLSDALNLAGGTGNNPQSDKITVYRGETRILSEKRVAEAVQNGATLEELGLMSGDQVRVPVPKVTKDWRLAIQPIFLGVSVLTALLAIIRASYTP